MLGSGRCPLTGGILRWHHEELIRAVEVEAVDVNVTSRHALGVIVALIWITISAANASF
jgi:hypothetical protein